MKKLLFLVLPLLLISCEKDLMEVDALGQNADIIGTWVETLGVQAFVAEDGIARFDRAKDLNPDSYGFVLNADGTFKERKNAGWCGTPPISYDNFEGTWEPWSDSLLDITVAYWGGSMTYQMRIMFVEGDKLGIRYLYEESRVDTK